ncbi:hypothetical protein [Nocardia miyunensis]|uniref:hypothetical protein n=1 Tax=Nocardia miyunensis TaxID=282684 RepID=UPI0008365CFB|nr:hypothetical protein [Nocardia miyunensis]
MTTTLLRALPPPGDDPAATTAEIRTLAVLARDTLAFASVTDPASLALVGAVHLGGLTGVERDGSAWIITEDTERHPTQAPR